MDWYNEPPKWTVDGDTITMMSGPKTDFWRTTHYGFIRDNGHFYHHRITGDFLRERRAGRACVQNGDRRIPLVQRLGAGHDDLASWSDPCDW